MTIDLTKNYPSLLTARQVIEVLRIGKRTLTRWLKIGKIKAMHGPNGKLLLFDTEYIRSIIYGNKSTDSQ